MLPFSCVHVYRTVCLPLPPPRRIGAPSRPVALPFRPSSLLYVSHLAAESPDNTDTAGHYHEVIAAICAWDCLSLSLLEPILVL